MEEAYIGVRVDENVAEVALGELNVTFENSSIENKKLAKSAFANHEK